MFSNSIKVERTFLIRVVSFSKIKNVMICGIDTYHDSAKKKGSVCAFIATSNEDKTRFFSRATLQESHQELSNNLTITVKCKLI
jgi:hypothetical protein